ncbi:MAG: hemolysin family protein [Acidimicrobiia bacterium]
MPPKQYSLVCCDQEARRIEVALGLLAALALILANGFFVAGEFALVAVDRARMEQMAAAGSRRARLVTGALGRLSFELSGAQFGITVTSLLLGFIAEPTVARAIQPLVTALPFIPAGATRQVSVFLALALATGTQMVMGELIPKNLAIALPVPSALNVAPPMAAVNRLFRWVISFLNESANWTVRRMGIEPQEELSSVRSLEELDLMIRSSAEHGGFDEAEAALLARSIEFGRKTAADVLVPRMSVVTVQSTDTLEELARVALRSGHSRFPVHSGDVDHVEGTVHVKDVYRVPPEQRAATLITEVARPALVVPEAQPLDDLLVQMRSSGRHLAVVVDEYGGTSGLVTMEDLLEEIVGEIDDEHDRAGRPASGASSRDQLFDGDLNRFEVEERTGLELPEGRFETLAGFVLARLGRIPQPGEALDYQGWRLEIAEVDRFRITQIRVIPPAGGAP